MAVADQKKKKEAMRKMKANEKLGDWLGCCLALRTSPRRETEAECAVPVMDKGLFRL